MQTLAAGSATGNKHIIHIHSTPVTVQMGSPGREAGRAMKKDEQSQKATQREEDKGNGWNYIFHEDFEEIAKQEIVVGGWRSEVLHLAVLCYDDG